MNKEMKPNLMSIDFIRYMEELKKNDPHKFVKLFYTAVTGDFDDSLKDTARLDEKLEAIKNLIKYFEDFQEYEKCAKLKELEKYLKENTDGDTRTNLRVIR